jgi:hypothetical protein
VGLGELLLLLGPLVDMLGQVHSCHDRAQLVELTQRVLVRPPQSLHVRLYHCRYFNFPASASAQQSGWCAADAVSAQQLPQLSPAEPALATNGCH